ncbi:hypothetical protein, partial [Pseudomonas avellanae]|uniref:hypothetical protein n=1 Tax=Pseudomonas avellanae TaxID=46257 RepID=UPI0019D3DE5F
FTVPDWSGVALSFCRRRVLSQNIFYKSAISVAGVVQLSQQSNRLGCGCSSGSQLPGRLKRQS